jgi:hypothetical protein
MIVARHGSNLGDLLGIDDRRKLYEWVRRFRPVLLEWAASNMNRCEAAADGDSRWIVYSGMVVTDGGVIHRDLVASTRLRQPIGTVTARTRGRSGRTRGGRRRARTRRPRSASGRPGRSSDDDPDPGLVADFEAVA